MKPNISVCKFRIEIEHKDLLEMSDAEIERRVESAMKDLTVKVKAGVKKEKYDLLIQQANNSPNQ